MAAGAGGTPAPLRLKDLLELDCDSCSAAGFRCYPRLLGESSPPTMRRLLDSSPSLRPRPASKLSHLSRSLSRRLISRGGFFWRRRDEDAAAAAAAPSASCSDSGASSETTSDDNSSSGRRGSRCGSDSDFSTASSASGSVDAGAATAGDVNEAMKRRGPRSSSGAEADDKEEQLSPVAVMNFPFDDDDEEEGEDGDADGGDRDAGASSPSPSFSLARLRRRKMLRTQHKIRRFGSAEELGPMDLEALLAATSDTDDLADDVPAQQVVRCRTEHAAAAPRPSRSHEPDEHGLLELLMDAASAGVDHVSERLLLDFFAEMKRRGGSKQEHSEELSAPAGLLPRKPERWGHGEVLAAARAWLDGGAGSARWGLNDVLRCGEAVVAEIERGRRWMRVGEEEREVGTVVAGMLADRLLDEVVWDLLV